jgi:hypothetical protein
MASARAAAVAGAGLIAGAAIVWSCTRGGGDLSAPSAPVATTAVIDAAPVRAAPDAAPLPPGPRWLKGNTHTHTDFSRDSHTAPRDVVRWYREHDYDFVVFTDHELVTGLDDADGLLVGWGSELTHNPEQCDPPPPEPHGHCRIHVNALFVSERPEGKLDWSDDAVIPRVDKYQLAFDQARALGGLIQVNHPNWHWGIDGAMLYELAGRGARLVEIANQAFVPWNVGRDGKYPSMTEIWDDALTRGATIWGVASDDAHNYYDVPFQREKRMGYGYPPGYGFVMVWSKPNLDDIRAAMDAGRFYSSTGVYLDVAEVRGGSYVIRVRADNFPPHTIRFIGAGGAELATQSGEAASFRLADAPPGYVRAEVVNKYGQRAWTQPVRVP